MAHLTAEQQIEIRGALLPIGKLIEQKSLASMSFVGLIKPIYSTAKGKLGEAYEEVVVLIDTMASEEGFKKSTTKRLHDINKIVSNLVEFNLWEDSYAHLSFGNLEGIVKMLSHMHKYGKEGKMVENKDGKKLSAKTVFPIMVKALKAVEGEVLTAINAHLEAESVAKGTAYAPIADLFTEYTNGANIYDDKIADKIAHLRKEFKLEEDTAKTMAMVSTLIGKMDKAEALLFLQKEMAKLSGEVEITEPANITENAS